MNRDQPVVALRREAIRVVWCGCAAVVFFLTTPWWLAYLMGSARPSSFLEWCLAQIEAVGFDPYLSVALGLTTGAFIAASVTMVRILRSTWRLQNRIDVRRMIDLTDARGKTHRLTVGVWEEWTPYAMTVGWWSPEIMVTQGFFEQLDWDEQQAVLWHEYVHVQNRDPLKAALLRIVDEFLGWLFSGGTFRQAYTGFSELAADRCAVQRMGNRAEHRLALGSALYKMMTAGTPSPAGPGAATGVIVDADETLRQRIQFLSDGADLNDDTAGVADSDKVLCARPWQLLSFVRVAGFVGTWITLALTSCPVI